jgi:hypothetical protein
LQRVLDALPQIPPAGPRVLLAQTVPAYRPPNRPFARDLLRVLDVGLRLLSGERRWSVQVVKPKPSPPTASVPDHAC